MQLLDGPADAPGAGHDVPVQAHSDRTLIALWLAGNADRTIRAYQDDVAAFASRTSPCARPRSPTSSPGRDA